MLDQAHRWRFRQRRSRAFTLLELLVVISIIGALMTVVATSLGDARRQAHTVVCGSRLREWARAFDYYAAEYDGDWPHCDGLDRGPDDINNPNISPGDLADWHGWVDVLPPILDRKPWRDHPRNEYPKEATFFQCPIGRAFEEQGLYGYRPLRDGYFSYAMNSCLELDANAWPPYDGLGYPMPSFLNTGRIVTPQRVILLFDQLLDPRKGYDARKVYRDAGKHCGTYPKSFTARHRSGRDKLGGNVLYCDGHVEWKRRIWKDHWNDDLEVPPRNDPNWYPYPAATPVVGR